MKVFITGATGFIGKHLVRSLQKEGIEVAINLQDGEESPFSESVKNYFLCKKDILSDIEFFIRENFDGIIHLASLYLTDHDPEDVGHLIESNVKFGTYVLECGAKAKVKWFINTGTFWQDYQNSDYSPVNLYAASKQAFESIAQYYIETNQIRFCTIRLSDTYGLEDTRPKIFNHWIRIAKTGETLDMSWGEQIIDISYIDDIVNAYVLLASHLQNNNLLVTNGSVYATKAEKRYTLKELAAIFEEITGSKLSIKWGARSYREREVMIPWENAVVVPDWKPKVSIKEGLKLILNQT